jgi:hypothetical protein
MATLRELLSESNPAMDAIRSHLNSLDNATRIAETRALGRSHLRKLFDAASGFQSLTLDFLVPATTAPQQEVVHFGKNSLGVFTHFCKVFMKPTAGSELAGYNRTSAFVQTVVGPGYYVARPYEVPGELLVDYLRLPSERAPGWPPILSNSERLSYFVYRGTQDVLRGVSNHVSIGRAQKAGKPMPAWFILCRQA